MSFFSDKTLRKNFSFLFVLQITNYIIPLLLFPYLGRTLGSENFGKIMFAQAFIAYFILFTDFGFNVSATKIISLNQSNKDKISIVFWNTMLAKFCLLVICFCIFLFTILFFNRFKEDSTLYFIAFINVLSTFLFPLWLFQGLEKMGLIAIVNTVPRIMMFFLIFYYVKDPSDYKLALLIQTLVVLCSALLSLWIIFYFKWIIFMKPSIHKAKIQILDSWHIFATSLSSNLYTTTNTVILGLLTNNAVVGFYSAADKIVRALISLLSSVNQVIFPRINIYYKESKEKWVTLLRNIMILMTLICFLIVVVLYFYSDKIIILLLTEQFSNAINVLKYSSILLLFSVINGIIALNIFIVLGWREKLLKIVLSGCLFSLCAIIPLVLYAKELGPVICAILTEVLIFILFFRTFKKHLF